MAPSLMGRFGLSAGDIQLLASIALVLLTAALAWATFQYTRHTKRMVEEIRKQNRPYIYILYEEDDPVRGMGRHRLVLRNAGNRVGQHITINVRQDALIVQAQPEPVGKGEDEVAWIHVAIPVSSIGICKNGVAALAPGEQLYLGFSQWYRSRTEQQKLVYDIAYSDGAGVHYRESLSLEYWICPP